MLQYTFMQNNFKSQEILHGVNGVTFLCKKGIMMFPRSCEHFGLALRKQSEEVTMILNWVTLGSHKEIIAL